MSEFFWVLGVIMSAGFLGGSASYWIEIHESQIRFERSWKRLGGLLILGISASFISPLFLEIFNAGGDSLIFSIFSDDPEKKKKFFPYLLLLFSYCCLFSVFARRFIVSTYDQFMSNIETKAIDKAENVAERTASIEANRQAMTLLDDQAEDLLVESASGTDAKARLEIDLSSCEIEVLHELFKTNTTSIKKQDLVSKVSFSSEELEQALLRLNDIGYLRSLDRDGLKHVRLRVRGLARIKKIRNQEQAK